ncbi:phospholipase D family protein [Vibrio parahaemolyticus]|uniref:phospholipase D family protein n=1 Tax=Vibrio harveyi group TaxID=717610 RepID=UPI002F2BD08B|nr:phospholipase D family protein [Vibrio parahaemolyticus]MCF9479104.1 phospholipase D family protein [Vibrio parahaemolyticus]MCF9577055.1 phospholipase D family protein [Vibrio parahaemolyticus]MCF9578732.1 phospholipase D family protein [Vibrio parahaemolyticus]MCF9628734.1 phospholipase D family protein [Vibrio parahaemolyticus]
MKLITNNKTLEKKLIQLANTYEQISVAVAWASAGTKFFDALMSNKDKLVESTIGTHFYQTDPDVLRTFVESEQVHFVMQPSGVFHPKLYFFRTGKKWEAIVGSANMTNSAFSVNNEMSVHLTDQDDGDGSTLEQVVKQLSEYHDLGVSVNTEYVNTYSIHYQKQRSKLEKLSGQYGSAKTSKSLFDSVVMQMDWSDYVERVQQDNNHAIEGRLELLDIIQGYFKDYDNYASMPLGARKTIAGLPNDTHEHWAWFGSMKGAGVYHSNINNNNPYISEALDRIPLHGKVTMSHYNRYVESFKKAFPKGRDGISIASRLLAMKRPDFFVCIDSKNNKAMCSDFGVKVSDMTYERYWSELISRVHDSLWYDEDQPSDEFEYQIWKGRVALLDCIFYEEE